MSEPLQISLAAARVNANLSQDDVVKALNISKATLVNWEQGKSEPKLTQVQKLSRLYKMPIDNIRFGKYDF